MPAPRQHRPTHPAEHALLVAALLASLWALGPLGSSLQGSTSTNSICLSLTVLGTGSISGEDPCAPEEDEEPEEEGEEGGVSGSTDGETTTDALISGGRRGTIERSHSRMVELILEYMRRRRERRLTDGHPAASGWPDVPMDAWYADDVMDFTRKGYLDPRAGPFRPNDGATRGEVTSLLVAVAGYKNVLPARPSFDDVPRHHAFFAVAEEAGARGWMKGYGDCYGTHPCFDRLGAVITRAEAANVIIRFYDLKRTGDAPRFADVPAGQWYARVMQIAADHCIVRGDGDTGYARPSSPVTRAELVAMMRRASRGLKYGTDCQRGDAMTAGAVTPSMPGNEAWLIPSRAASSDAVACAASGPRCLWRAIKADAAAAWNALWGSVTLPDASTIAATHPSELGVWIAGILWLVILVRIAHRHRMHRVSVVHKDQSGI